jgi:hypothetical protein
MVQTEFVEVAKVNEIPDGKMKHFEVDGKETGISSKSLNLNKFTLIQ